MKSTLSRLGLAALLTLTTITGFSCGAGCSGDKAESPKTSPEAEEPAPPMTDRSKCLDGKKALAHIEKIVAFGARHAGTKGLEDTRGYIISTLEGFGLEPQRRDFRAYTPHPDMKEVMMANITVDIPGKTSRKKIIIGGHFDGKIIEKGVFLGANDGGSSTGLLLEMARCLSTNPPPSDVRIAFFDGEEAIVKWTDSDSLYGSKKMAADLLEKNEHKKVAAMVNVDMIGDKRLRIHKETLSTPWVFAALARTAGRLGHEELMTGSRVSIGDDHLPFLKIGIPSANLIDLKFGPGYESNAYWHTDQDTVDKISAKNMEAVGEIVLESLPLLLKGPPAGSKRP